MRRHRMAGKGSAKIVDFYSNLIITSLKIKSKSSIEPMLKIPIKKLATPRP